MIEGFSGESTQPPVAMASGAATSSGSTPMSFVKYDMLDLSKGVTSNRESLLDPLYGNRAVSFRLDGTGFVQARTRGDFRSDL